MDSVMRELWQKSGLSSLFSSAVNSPFVELAVDIFHGNVGGDSFLEVFVALMTLIVTMYLYGGCYVDKVGSWLWASIYFCAARDRGVPWQSFTDDDDICPRERHRKLIFINHGQSEWNVIFDTKGINSGFFKSLLGAIVREATLWVQKDSVFIDSPLSSKGVDQSFRLLKHLAEFKVQEVSNPESKSVKDMSESELIAVLRGDLGDSIMVSSQLRRAISTIIMCLMTRLARKDPPEKLHMLSMLQEVGRSPDTVSLTPTQDKPRLPLSEAGRRDAGDMVALAYEKYVEASGNDGNKGLWGSGPQRQEEFCKWLFDVNNVEHVIVCSHSLWFRGFFNALLPGRSSHWTKKEKLKHCQVLAFDCYSGQQDGRAPYFRVDESSITELYQDLHGREQRSR